jgi:transketolase
MRVIPNMTVIAPCDSVEAHKVTVAISDHEGPCYVRFAREKTPVFTTEETPFEIGKAITLRKGKDVAIIGCGPLLYKALVAAEELSKEGIEALVINSHTIKPLDEDAVIHAAESCGAVVTVEEHQAAGGLGGAVAECLAKHHPVPMEFIGVQDRFGESGDPVELIEHFSMGIRHIKAAVKKALKRKGK